MKNIYKAFTLLFLSALSLHAQSPMDFNRKDCNGVQRHLFGDLDSGKAVIIEYFMINCGPCPVAGALLESLKTNLLSQYPGKVVSYAIAYNNTYSKAVVNNWVTSNGFSAIPMDSGATQVANYGGMGMPTIVVLAGKITHSILASPYIGFNTSDTTQVGANIRNYLNSNPTGLSESAIFSSFKAFPVPAKGELSVSFTLEQVSDIRISLFDLQGRLVRGLDSFHASSGECKRTFSVEEFSSGNYILKVRTNTQTYDHKITISN